MNFPLPVLSLLAVATMAWDSATAQTLHLTPGSDRVDAIGGLNIDGILYDVSFNGAFGTRMFLGNESGAKDARDAITALLNSYFQSVPFNGLPEVANDSNGGGVYKVTFASTPGGGADGSDLSRYYLSIKGAGWTYPDALLEAGGSVYYDENPPRALPPFATGYYEATFRPAIPGAIVDNVPELSTTILASLSLFGLVRRRR